MSYGFIRNTDTWGVNSIPFDQYQKQGIDSLLFAANDPHLQQAIANARAHNMKAGIWADPHDSSPWQFANYLNGLSGQYNPDLLVPDVEFTGKGYKGSPGWNWSEAFMNKFRGMNANQKLGLTVMPNQADFNYGAYLRGGTDVFLPQAYGATYDTQFDPEKVRQTLLDAGVPADKISVALAPGQRGNGGAYYALDDFGNDPRKFAGNLTRGGGHIDMPVPRPSAPAKKTLDLAALRAAVQEGLANPRRYMLQARVNPGARHAVNTVLRRQVASTPSRGRR